MEVIRFIAERDPEYAHEHGLVLGTPDNVVPSERRTEQ
jgi:hypothetical protein